MRRCRLRSHGCIRRACSRRVAGALRRARGSQGGRVATPEGQQWFARLTQDADALALRKVHAYALLKSRGHQLPLLADLPVPTP